MWSSNKSTVNAVIALIAISAIICGAYAKPPSQIIGGENAAPDEFPGVVRLLLNNATHDRDCGGAIITKRHILTAGHCLEGAISAKVYGGTHIRNDPNAIVRDAINIIRHPHYSLQKKGIVTVINNDIGILVLDRDINLGRRQKILPLPINEPEPYTHGVIAGWGRTSYSIPEVTSILKKTEILVMPESICPLSHLPEKFCGVRTSAGACPGDSGSPLVNSAGQIVGLLSTSLCEPGIPQVYTNVYYQLPWIESILNQGLN